MDWQAFIENIAINSGIGAILAAVKNPVHAAQLKGVLLHLADTIYIAFGLVPAVHD